MRNSTEGNSKESADMRYDAIVSGYVSMDHISRNGYEFLARVISLFIAIFLLVLTFAIWLSAKE